MRRFREKAKSASGGHDGWGAPPDPVGVDAELLDFDGPGSRYAVREIHPVVQLATRIGLWAAVVIGALGGLFGLIRPPVQQVEAAVQQIDDGALVPAPVAGTAELVVEAWLTASEADDAEAVDHLFVDPPTLADINPAGLVVEEATAVSAEQRAAGYWSVTVAVDVVETVLVEGAEVVEGEAPETAQVPSTWYVEVGIAGDVGGGLAAIAPPAVVPGPPPVDSDWLASAEDTRPAGDTPLAATVEGFLQALLAGGGDPTRYLAPGGELDAMDPAPFEAVQLMRMSADELEDGQTRVLAEALVTTPGGARMRLTYEIVLGEWADRWEVTSFSGAPTMVASAPENEAGDEHDNDDNEDEPDREAEAEPGVDGEDGP